MAILDTVTWNEAEWGASSGGLLAQEFRAYRALEGPQVVVQWRPPVDVDQIQALKLVRRERRWPLSHADGTALATVTDLAGGRSSYSDRLFDPKVTAVVGGKIINSTARYVPDSLIGATLYPDADVPTISATVTGNTATEIQTDAADLTAYTSPGTTYALSPEPTLATIAEDVTYYYTLFSQLNDGTWIQGAGVRAKVRALRTGFFQHQFFSSLPPNWRQADRT